MIREMDLEIDRISCYSILKYESHHEGICQILLSRLSYFYRSNVRHFLSCYKRSNRINAKKGSVPLLQVHFSNNDYLIQGQGYLALGLYQRGSQCFMEGVRFWRNGLKEVGHNREKATHPSDQIGSALLYNVSHMTP